MTHIFKSGCSMLMHYLSYYRNIDYWDLATWTLLSTPQLLGTKHCPPQSSATRTESVRLRKTIVTLCVHILLSYCIQHLRGVSPALSSFSLGSPCPPFSFFALISLLVLQRVEHIGYPEARYGQTVSTVLAIQWFGPPVQLERH